MELAHPYCNGPSKDGPVHHWQEEEAEMGLVTAMLVHRHYNAHLPDNIVRSLGERKAEVRVGNYFDLC